MERNMAGAGKEVGKEKVGNEGGKVMIKDYGENKGCMKNG
jgi:hypothetical protein